MQLVLLILEMLGAKGRPGAGPVAMPGETPSWLMTASTIGWNNYWEFGERVNSTVVIMQLRSRPEY